MTPLQTKQKAFLDEMVKHFNSTNRAYNPDTRRCSYEHSVNGGCAIGRKCTKAQAEKLEKKTGGVYDVWRLLPDKLKRLEMSFLDTVQSLHDGETYWNETGLTNTGTDEYDYICDQFGLTN